MIGLQNDKDDTLSMTKRFISQKFNIKKKLGFTRQISLKFENNPITQSFKGKSMKGNMLKRQTTKWRYQE